MTIEPGLDEYSVSQNLQPQILLNAVYKFELYAVISN